MSDLHRVPAWVFISTTRYALGRMSYHPREVTDLLRQHWHALDKATKDVIRRDVREFLDRPRFDPWSGTSDKLARAPWIEFVDWEEADRE